MEAREFNISVLFSYAYTYVFYIRTYMLNSGFCELLKSRRFIGWRWLGNIKSMAKKQQFRGGNLSVLIKSADGLQRRIIAIYVQHMYMHKHSWFHKGNGTIGVKIGHVII